MSASRLAYQKMFERTPDGLVLLGRDDDGDFRYEAVNPAAIELMGIDADELSGARPNDVLDDDVARILLPLYREVLETGDVAEISLMLGDDADERAARCRIHTFEQDGERRGVFVILQDVTRLVETRRELQSDRDAIRQLYEVAGSTDLELSTKMQRLLEIGRSRLELPLGFITDIEGGIQRILAAVGDHPEVEEDATAPLEEAYCRHTIASDGLVAYQNAAEEGMAGDPAFERFELACYVGAKLVVHDEVAGTVCFADAKARNESFTEGERTFVRLLAQWVGREIERTSNLGRVQRQARTDSLTGLANHGELMRRLESLLETDRDVTVALMDLDHFKQVNDRYGHLVGDEVLCEVGELMERETRQLDLAARYGGEEFCVVFDETSLATARKIADRLADEVRQMEFEAEGRSIELTCSIGVASRRATDEAPTDLLSRADRSLYQAKQRGRDRVVNESDVERE